MTGNADNIDRAASLWPGNDVVDWISWNVYNQSGCHSGTVDQDKFKSFDDELEPFYDFVKKRGASIGMDSSKPMMISEAGSVQYPSAPELSAAGTPRSPRHCGTTRESRPSPCGTASLTPATTTSMPTPTSSPGCAGRDWTRP